MNQKLIDELLENDDELEIMERLPGQVPSELLYLVDGRSRLVSKIRKRWSGGKDDRQLNLFSDEEERNDLDSTAKRTSKRSKSAGARRDH